MPTRLVDALRELSDPQLAALLAARPDLAVPVPADLSALSSRAQSRLSLARALEGLDRFTLEILDAVRLAAEPTGATTVGDVVALATSVPEGRVRAALASLRELAIVYGPDTELHVVHSVNELCPPYPAGLGRPAAELDPQVAALAADPGALRRELLAAPPAARAVLDRLAAGPPVGTVREPDSDGPVRWLLDHRLLAPDRIDTVQLPRELGLVLRREVGPLGELHPDPPVPDPPVRSAGSVDSAGAGQVMEVLRLTAALCDALADRPAPVLKSGGLGVRDLRRLAETLACGEGDCALLLEVAAAAALITEADGEVPAWLPTAGYDDWRSLPPAQRWVRLAYAWLELPRQPGLIGTRDDKDKAITPLSGGAARLSAPSLRRAALGVLTELPTGAAPAVDDVVALLSWRSPRRAGRAADATRWALAEAATLGVTGRGALTGYGRELLVDAPDGEPDPLGIEPSPAGPDPAVPLAELLPAPVDTVLLQADLTVVVPGPPEPALAAELELVADVESAGQAAVYRVTTASVRRALDAGLTAADLHTLFARRSSTPVPQALTYLVDDVARRHGGLRVGACSAYLRSEDTALLAQLVADRRLGLLALRQVAPTVLISPFQVHRLLDMLRDAGYAPVAEDAGGVVLAQRPDQPRALARTRPRVPPRELPAQLRSDQLDQVIAALRRGERAARAANRAPNPDVRSTADAITVLREAIATRKRIWVGYVDAHGGNVSRLVRPVSIGAGYLRAADDRTETLHTFSLHRIVSATPAEV